MSLSDFKGKRITLTLGHSESIMIGDYETVKPRVEVSIELSPDDDPAVAYDNLSTVVEKLFVEATLDAIRKILDRRRALSGVSSESLVLEMAKYFKSKL